MHKCRLCANTAQSQTRAAALRAASSGCAAGIASLVRQARVLDLAFLCDTTASMLVRANCACSSLTPAFLSCVTNADIALLQVHLDNVKVEIWGIVDNIRKGNPGCTLRVAFVGYIDDDHPAGAKAPLLDFTGNVQDLRRLLDQIAPTGGTDYAEDVFSGLQAAGSLSWTSTNRVLVHVGDHPCHGIEFHNFIPTSWYDRYPSGDPWGRKAAHLLRRLAEGCKLDAYLFCHLTEHTQKMVKRFKEQLGMCTVILMDHMMH